MKPDELIAAAIEQGASDIHLTPDGSSYQLHVRIQGVITPLQNLGLGQGRVLIQALKAAAGMNIADVRKPQDARLHRAGCDLRLSTHPSLHGESLVIRLFGQWSRQTLHGLGFSKTVQQEIIGMLEHDQGLILVAGPTGSGKTTTLHAMLNHLGKQAGRIMTLEDPVEIVNPDAIQTDLSRLQTLDFASGLRSLMRQDPDTLLIGEIRDTDTAELALQAALTGHRVFASVHAPDCLGAISRMVELQVRIESLLNCLIGIQAQRLLRCPVAQERLPEAEIMNLRRLPRAALLSCHNIAQLHALVEKTASKPMRPQHAA